MDDSGVLAVMPTGMEVMFFVVVGFIAVVFGLIVWRTVAHRFKPRETAQATCVGKRQSGTDGTSWHHATFEFLDGTRAELHTTGRAYGLLVEGDRGALTYQGDVMRSFIRGNAVGRD